MAGLAEMLARLFFVSMGVKIEALEQDQPVAVSVLPANARVLPAED